MQKINYPICKMCRDIKYKRPARAKFLVGNHVYCLRHLKYAHIELLTTWRVIPEERYPYVKNTS